MTVRIHWEENGAGQRVSCRDLVEAGSQVFELVQKGIPPKDIMVDGTPLDEMPEGWWKAAIDEANRR